MIMTVWHLDWERARAANAERFHDAILDGDEKAIAALMGAGYYAPIATIEAEDPEEVYALSQSIHAPWIEGARVEAMVNVARSTSVGDVVVLPGGAAMIVKGIGFERSHLTGIAVRVVSDRIQKALDELEADRV